MWPNVSAVVVGSLLGPRYPLERLDVGGEHRPDAILALHHAIDDEDGLAVCNLPVAVVDVRLDRHVHLPKLVLEGEEADLLGGRRRLARDDEPGDPDPLAAWDRGQLVAFERAELVQALP